MAHIIPVLLDMVHIIVFFYATIYSASMEYLIAGFDLTSWWRAWKVRGEEWLPSAHRFILRCHSFTWHSQWMEGFLGCWACNRWRKMKNTTWFSWVLRDTRERRGGRILALTETERHGLKLFEDWTLHTASRCQENRYVKRTGQGCLACWMRCEQVLKRKRYGNAPAAWKHLRACSDWQWLTVTQPSG